jgi:uncharacterized OB-fold protein
MDRYELAGRGTLVDYVIVERGPAGFAVPYFQAYVKLNDGPKIYSMLEEVQIAEPGLTIGQPMEMLIETIRSDGSVDIVGWKFRPSKALP